MDNLTIKDNLRKIRKERKLTQEEMAGMLDISLTAYRDLEKGSTNIINGKILKIAEFLDTSAEELVLGYRPSQESGRQLQDVQAEYGERITSLQRRIADLEDLILSLKESLKTKNEIIAMLRKALDEAGR